MKQKKNVYIFILYFIGMGATINPYNSQFTILGTHHFLASVGLYAAFTDIHDFYFLQQHQNDLRSLIIKNRETSPK